MRQPLDFKINSFSISLFSRISFRNVSYAVQKSVFSQRVDFKEHRLTAARSDGGEKKVVSVAYEGYIQAYSVFA